MAAFERGPDTAVASEPLPDALEGEALGAVGVGAHAPPTPARRSLTSRLSGFGFVFWLATAWLVAVFICAVFANILPVRDPLNITVSNKLNPPFSDNILGADGLGRDILARIVHGARVSVTIALSAVTVGMVVGGTLGMTVGYFRGRPETFVMAVIDVILGFPGLVLLLAMVAFVGQSLTAISLVIGFLSIPVYTRVARANTLSVAQREFVLAAKAMGARHTRILFREILPNVILPVLAFAFIAMGVIVVLEGALAFLGLSVQAPTPTWGSMINEGRRHFRDAGAHVAMIPSAVMFLTVLSLNFVGDTLRRRFDVREANL